MASSTRNCVYKFDDFNTITDTTMHADLTGALPVDADDGSMHELVDVMVNCIHVELQKQRGVVPT